MRILMLAQFYPPDIGGEERHVHSLAAALVKRGHHVEVVTSALPQTAVGSTDEGGVVVHRIKTTAQRFPLHGDAARPHATPFPDFEMQRAISRVLSSVRFDIVHAHNWIVNSALGPAARACVPVVLTLHDYSHICAVKRFVFESVACSGPRPVKCLLCAGRHYGALVGPSTVISNTHAARRRDAGLAYFIAVSSAVVRGNQIQDGVVPWEVIPNFIPDDLIGDFAPQPDGPILFVGDLTSQKGVLVLAEAYRRMNNPPPLLMVGRPTPGVAIDPIPGLTLLGPKAHSEILPLMRNARFVVVPSVMPDPCPTVVLEAMAVGRPVVASANGGIVEMVIDRVTGNLVLPGDPVQLADAMSALASDRDAIASMGTAAVERVRSFTASAVVDRILAIYDRSITKLIADGASNANVISTEFARN